MFTVDPELAPLVCVARVSQIWRRSRWAVFLYVLVFIPLGLGSSFASDHPILFGVMVSLFLGTGILRWRTLLTAPPPTDPVQAERWLRSCGLQTLLSGVIWGLFSCYMQLAYRGVFLQFAILLISSGIGCFALGAFAGERKLTLRYLAGAMLPTLAGLLAVHDGEAILLSGLMLLFLATVVFQLNQINDWFLRSTVESLLLERSRKEAESAARVKSEFLANMSHELRTPMNGVMGMLELLLQSDLNRDQALLAKTSHRSAEALLDILNDILDFSKMSAGKLEFVRKDFLLRNVIEDVFDVLAQRAMEKGLDLGYRIEESVPEWVCGDEGRLRQVLMNLVSNGIKFSYSGEWPNGGSVVIETLLMESDPTAVHLAFRVADQGQGMSAATIAKLFQPFMQADTSTSRRFGGTGLGLAISRQLVEAMGGTIAAESTHESGTQFHFDVKLAPASATVPPARKPAVGRILVIEPATHSRETIGSLLRRRGASVVVAATVDEASRHLMGNAFDAILAGTSPAMPFAGMRARLVAEMPPAQTPVFYLYNRGESVAEGCDPAFSLPRPIRDSQIEEVFSAMGKRPAPPAAAPSDRPAALSGHVLIAEDNAVNQMLAQRLVGALGLTAEVVSNGNAVLTAVAKGKFRLVLMDCQMPGMDGYEATRHLREDPAHRHLPVIAMTANAMKGDREVCLAAGMNDYVSKPIRLDRLREVLSRYLAPAPTVPESESSK